MPAHSTAGWDSLDSVLAFDNSYARLPGRFWRRVDPTPVPAPRLLAFNDDLAAGLGLDGAGLTGATGAALFAGNLLPSTAVPIALAYAGHQFGHFVPQLGDGRAILLGELQGRDGRRWDLQLKGAGRTPFSRGGDGRAALGPVLREYLVSEGMHALGIATTRSLAAVATGEPVMRETPLPGAVLARVASSHVRIGTFQFFAARGDDEAVALLVDHVIDRLYPELAGSDSPPLALLAAIANRQAELVARWQQIGFVHGVMNTDNMAVSGETLDYGPCAFLDTYHPDAVFSAIDQHGRYAYARQPLVAQWNLARLAESLLPLLDRDADTATAAATEVLASFQRRFDACWLTGMAGKLGLTGQLQAGDERLVQDFLDLLQADSKDFTLAFRALADLAEGRDTALCAHLPSPRRLEPWQRRWQQRLGVQPDGITASTRHMRQVNPAVIARNHQVHAALTAAEQGDLGPFDALLRAVRRPYTADGENAAYLHPPTDAERVLRTFCGT